jgi:hypothetical protein
MLDEDSVNPILNDEQRNRLYISELRKWKSIETIKKENNLPNELNFKRRDLLSKFWY